MSKARLCLIVPLAIIAVGCSLSSNATNAQISDVGYSISNVPVDYWWASSSSQTPSLVYKFTLQFSGELSSSDINSARIYIGDTSSTSRYWSFYSSDFDASLSRLSANNFWWTANDNELPIGHLDANTGAIKAGLNSGQAFNNENLDDNLLAIQQTGISDSSGSIISLADFNNIAKCRVVVCDGAQYEYLGKYSYYDYRAIFCSHEYSINNYEVLIVILLP